GAGRPRGRGTGTGGSAGEDRGAAAEAGAGAIERRNAAYVGGGEPQGHGGGGAAIRGSASARSWYANGGAMLPLPTFPNALNLADYFLFDRLAEGLGDKDAILFGERRYTYADVAERARALAGFLAAAGVRREERVLIVLHDTPAFAWAFFATLWHGAVVAMGNPEAPAADLAYLVEYTRAAAVITIPKVAAAIRPTLAAASLRALVLSPEVGTGGDVEADPDISGAEGVASLAPVSLRDAISEGRVQ